MSPIDDLALADREGKVVALRRRAELGALVAAIDAIMFSEAIDAEGAVVFEKAVELDREGIVSKRLGGAYWTAG